jgi:hypothetical protein
MHIKIILLGILRDKITAEKRGIVEMDFPAAVTINEIASRMKLPDGTACAVNGQLERDPGRQLLDGDELTFFRPGAGG